MLSINLSPSQLRSPIPVGAPRRWKARTAWLGVFLAVMAAPVAARPPFAGNEVRLERDFDADARADFRRSLERSYGDYRQDGYRERRRMSEAERESLRQAVRDAYRDSRYRRRD